MGTDTVCPVLEELRITGLGVIDDTTLRLTSGMNVITGETGAGKTMVVTGLGLLFGGRADAGRVRADPGRAVVEGRLRLRGALADAVQARITDAGAELDDDGSVLLSRTVTIEGRSRAHVGGRSMPVAMLAEVGEQVLAVHGQSDQLRLLRPAEQRARARPVRRRRAREAAGDLSRGVRPLARGGRRPGRPAAQRPRPLAGGRPAQARPRRDQPGRPAAGRGRRAARRGAAARARRGSAGGRGAWPRRRWPAASRRPTTRPTPPSCSALARRTLEAQSGGRPALGELAARIEEAATLVGDVSAELSAYLSALDADPARLEQIYERRAALRGLTRKYADDVEGVIAWAENARTRLAALDTSDELLEELDKERQRLAAQVGELAGRLTAARRRGGRPVLRGGQRRAGRAGDAALPGRGRGGAPGGRARRADRDGRRCRARRRAGRRRRGGAAAAGPPGRAVAAAAEGRVRAASCPG